MWQGLKQRLRRRVFEAMEAERRERAGHQNLVLGPRSQLFSQAEVRNLCGPRDSIRVGADSFIRGVLLTHAGGAQIEIGDWCYVGHRTEIWAASRVQIGNRVLISHDVNIHDSASHPVDTQDRHEHFKQIITRGHSAAHGEFGAFGAAPIVIEDDVWVSFGVTILRGVRIGRGSVIGARSVVLDDVPPNSIYTCDIHPRLRSLDEGRVP